MTRLKELLKKADKAAVISMTVAAVAMAALGAGGVKTYDPIILYRSMWTAQKKALSLMVIHGTAIKTDRLTTNMTVLH